MNAPTAFDPMPVGAEFETATEEFERTGFRRGAASRQGRARQGPPRRAATPLRRAPPPRGGLPDTPPPRRARPPRSPRSRGAHAAWWPWGIDPMPFGQGALYRRCVQSCLAAGAPASAAAPPDAPVPEPGPAATAATSDGATDDAADSSSPDQEMTMHKPSCQCPRCAPDARAFEFMNFEPRRAGTFEGEGGQQEFEEEGEQALADESQYEGPGEQEGGYEGEAQAEDEEEGEDEGGSEYEGGFPWREAGRPEGLFSESEEIALAAELLSVTNEAEFEQFMGSLWKGIRKVGSTVARAARPFAGVLRSVTKAALPFVGGALGSLIPIPGVGTAVGTALGGALSKALELEYGTLEAEDREFEMARSVVRIAGTAARNFQPPPPGGDIQAAVQSAITDAARQHLPGFRSQRGSPAAAMSGTWVRQGGRLLVLGT